MDHMENNNLLSDFQHGFRKMHSCETQLIMFIDELAKGMCMGEQYDVAIMDFSKAFRDVVPHECLLVKLDHYGIKGNTHKWIRSFLSDRTQQVVVDGDKSSSAPVTSGVPQGTVLGQILFLAFINDMPESIKAKCRLFADDSIIYTPVENEDDCKGLQQDLDALQEWERQWGMSFNPSKCNIMHVSRKKSPLTHTYYLKGKPLGVVDNAGYLGVNISKDLSWHRQVTKVTSKPDRTLGLVKRNIKTPSLDYASSMWDSHQKGLIQDVEKISAEQQGMSLQSMSKKQVSQR